MFVSKINSPSKRYRNGTTSPFRTSSRRLFRFSTKSAWVPHVAAAGFSRVSRGPSLLVRDTLIPVAAEAAWTKRYCRCSLITRCAYRGWLRRLDEVSAGSGSEPRTRLVFGWGTRARAGSTARFDSKRLARARRAKATKRKRERKVTHPRVR